MAGLNYGLDLAEQLLRMYVYAIIMLGHSQTRVRRLEELVRRLEDENNRLLWHYQHGTYRDGYEHLMRIFEAENEQSNLP